MAIHEWLIRTLYYTIFLYTSTTKQKIYKLHCTPIQTEKRKRYSQPLLFYLESLFLLWYLFAKVLHTLFALLLPIKIRFQNLLCNSHFSYFQLQNVVINSQFSLLQGCSIGYSMSLNSSTLLTDADFSEGRKKIMISQ